MVGATLRDTANPTMLSAGYKANVIPSVAEATIDCRVLPGREMAFERELDEILGSDVEREWLNLPSVETSFDGALVDTMVASLRHEDPGAAVLPYMLSGGTDAKSFQRLGMRCFGFAPLRLPADLDFTALFHGVDERVPVDALEFGTRCWTGSCATRRALTPKMSPWRTGDGRTRGTTGRCARTGSRGRERW